MIKTILIGAGILFIAVLLMGVKIFFTKEGKFPDIHIGDNKAMQERGIGCATSQDAQIRSKINPVKQILKSKNHK
ncbi:MAG: hypothetical protein WAP46_06365 [Dysgonamonadaceae bacterium]|jgi:hypothetical protein|nr:hypothetical protein [Dysgonamonadaceae bacterium]